MPHRRILSLWFPRLGAERLIRSEPHLAGQPFAIVRQDGAAQVLCSLSPEASGAGLYQGQPLRDAYAMCGDLLTRPHVAHHEAAFLDVLHRWAGKFSPWVAAEPPEGLVIDLTGCAHLFGGEEALAKQVTQDCADLGLTTRLGIADTLGAAWALARYTHEAAKSHRSGDAIQQEARATRAKAGKRRHWERGGAAPMVTAGAATQPRIAPSGEAWRIIAPLPVAALRIDSYVINQLSRLGLRTIRDLMDQPRAGLARRFGRGLVDRLDQATGAAPEPVSSAPPPDRYAARMSFPDPIGLENDVAEATSRMLTQLCERLKKASRGARALRLEAYRCDHIMMWRTVISGAASFDPYRLMPLLRLKIPEIEAGPGIDMLRLEVTGHDPLHARTMAGHLEAAEHGIRRLNGGTEVEDLIGRLGARIGMDAITRRHPGDSHIPEKGALTVTAAWSEPVHDWPPEPTPRPLLLWRPEPVTAPDAPRLSRAFRWRGRDFEAVQTSGPERIAPEWWLDDPNWRSGARDYWRVETTSGDRLWMFYAHGATMGSGWFCQGAFA